MYSLQHFIKAFVILTRFLETSEIQKMQHWNVNMHITKPPSDPYPFEGIKTSMLEFEP
ncbi:hypothetical protein LguiA_030986 [Lonicera macranthoides]